MALTIEIPKCNAVKSVEDKLAQFILGRLSNSKNGSASFDYYYRGCAVGNLCDESVGHVSLDVIGSVLYCFKQAGYIVDTHFYSNNIATVHINSK